MSPLQIPRPSQIDSSVTVSSHETFTTAFSSTPSASPVVSRFQSTTSPTSTTNTTADVVVPALLPPHSLRKSISVDSFISSRRPLETPEAGPSSAIQQRDHPREVLKGARRRELGDSVDKDVSDANIRAPQPTVAKSFASRLFARTRGHSLSGPPVEYDDPYLDDSEHEHVSDLVQLSSLASQRPQGPSSLLSNGLLKAKSRSRLNNDGLLLPPRSSLVSTLSVPSNSMASPTMAPSVPPTPSAVPVVASNSRKPVPNPLILPSTRPGSSSTTKPNHKSTEVCPGF